MFHVILYQPEIPPNAGNIIRTCAVTGARLHLIGPLGFTLDDARLRRAGLDYHEWATVQHYPSWPQFLALCDPQTLWAFSTRGAQRYDRAAFTPGDGLLFGPESRGLPATLLDTLPPARTLRLPMRPASRSLNLANAVAVALFEALRQTDFADLG